MCLSRCVRTGIVRSAIAEASLACEVKWLEVNDGFGRSGPAADQLVQLGLCAYSIYSKAKEILIGQDVTEVLCEELI